MCNLTTLPFDEMNNALIDIECLYYTPDSAASAPPAFVSVLLVFADSTEEAVVLPIAQLNAVGIHKAVPRFYVPRKDREEFDIALTEEFHRLVGVTHSGLLQMPAGESPVGYSFVVPGSQQLPDGKHVFVWGDEILGACSMPCTIQCSDRFQLRTEPVADPLPRLFAELSHAAPQLTLGMAYLFGTLLKSWITRFTTSWQAVLVIVGGQGLGKTTLARRLTDWVQDENGDPAALFSAGSTSSAIRDAIVASRDLPVVIDDLCLSTSAQLQRKHLNLCAQFVREGSNAAPIIKKRPGGKTIKQQCAAGVILTAEFSLDNASDISRCIFLPLDRPLQLPAGLTPALIGAGCKAFVEWWLGSINRFEDALMRALNTQVQQGGEMRSALNFCVLEVVTQALCEAARDAGTSEARIQAVWSRFTQAEEASLNYQQNLISSLDRQRKKGNIAALLLEGLEADAFDLCKKVEKLDHHEGIIWKGDLCLRRDALEHFIRLQDGYHTYTIAKIVQELKDIGALVLQEEGTAQVKLQKDTPRVYRIRIDVLEDVAIEY